VLCHTPSIGVCIVFSCTSGVGICIVLCCALGVGVCVVYQVYVHILHGVLCQVSLYE